MRLFDFLSVGVHALRTHLGRSVLTSLGIVVGVAAVICTMSIGAGAEDEVTETLRTLGANLLAVTPGAPSAHGVRMEVGSKRNLTERDALAIQREIPGVRLAAPLVSKRLQAIAEGRNWSTLVAGITPDYLAAREWTVAEGRPSIRTTSISAQRSRLLARMSRVHCSKIAQRSAKPFELARSLP